MTEFDLDPYFAAQDSGLTSNETPADIWNSLDFKQAEKQAELDRKAQQKRQALEALRQSTQQQQETYEDSWVGRAGLDPDSPAGTAVNLGASLVSGGSRLVGEMSTALPDLYSAGQEALIPDDVKQAYARIQRGEGSEQDQALINQTGFEDGLYEGGDSPTYRDRLDQTTEAREWATETDETFDLSGIVEMGDRQELSRQLAEGSSEGLASLRKAVQAFKDDDLTETVTEGVSGLADLFMTASESVLSNPKAVAEYAMEMVPQIASAAIGGTTLLATQSVGYAADAYREGVNRYREQNNGEYPPEDVAENMALNAAGIALANLVGTKTVAKEAGVMKDAVKKAVTPKKAAKGVKGIAQASTKAGAAETVTEGYQTYGEGEARYDPATGEEIFEGAVIGGAVGGGIAGAGKTVEELGRAKNETRKEEAEKEAETRELKEAAETGDISAYTDPKSDKYDLRKAAAVLQTRKEDGDADADAEIDRLLVQADKDLQKAETRVNKYTPDGIRDRESKLEALQNDLAAAESSEEKTSIQSEIDKTQQIVEALKNPEGRKAAEQRLTQAQASYNALNELKETQSAETVTAEAADLDTLKTDADLSPEVASTAEPAKRQEAAQKLTMLSMASPDVLSASEAGRLVKDGTNGLTDNQRNYLREFQRAQEARSQAQTNSDIFKGRDGYRGINQYRSLIRAAVQQKDDGQIDRYMKDLRSFARDHQSKANAVQSAMKRWQDTGKPQAVVRGKQPGTWTVSKQPMKRGEVSANGGLMIDGQSTGLVEGIRAESQALNAAGIEMTAMVNALTNQPQVKESARATKPQSQANDESTSPNPEEAAGDRPQAPQATDGDGVGTEPERTGELRTYDDWAKANAGKTVAIQYPKSKTPFVVTVNPETQDGSSGNEGTRVEFSGKTSRGKTVTFSETDIVNARETTPIEPNTLSNIRPGTGRQQPQAAAPAPNTPTETTTDDLITPESSEAVLEPIEKQPGALTILQVKAEDRPVITNENFESENLVQAFYTQSAGKEDGGGTRPLVDYDRFVSAVRAEPEIAAEYYNPSVNQDEEVTAGQRRALTLFTERAAEWMPVLDQILRDPSTLPEGKSMHYDMVQYFRDPETGQLPENIKAAIAYAAWDFLVDQEGSPITPDADTIRGILGMQDYEQPVTDDYKTFYNAGLNTNLMANTAGRKARQVLGIKGLSNAPADVEAKLDAALGGYAQALLVQAGLAERHTVKHDRMKSEKGQAFVRIKRDLNSKEKKAVPEIAEIGRITRGTQNYLDKLFGSDPAILEPSFEPPEFDQKTTKGTDSRIPENMKEIQQTNTQRPWKIRPWMYGLWRELAPEVQEAAMGVKNPDTAHKELRAGIEGKNAGLIRERDQFNEFVDQGIRGDYDKEFYLHPSVWVMQRVGYKNAIDPQNSKIIRHLIGMSAWNVDISTDFRDTTNRLFRQNVAMGLGIKADKQKINKTIQELNATLKDSVYQDALKALKKQIRDEGLTTEDQQAIKAAVEKAGEGMHSLDALHGYARMELARDNKQTSFNTDLQMMEVDGVTNGPMLTLLLLGAANSTDGMFKFLNRGGMYQTGAPFKNFVDFKSKGNNDLYESTVGAAMDVLGKEIGRDPRRVRTLEAVEYFKGGVLFDVKTGKVGKKGRNFIKTPLTGMMFGQAVNAGVGSMVDELIEDIYSKVTAINESDASVQQKQADLAEWATNVNKLISGQFPNRDKLIPTNPTMGEALNLVLTKEQTNAIRLAFTGFRNQKKNDTKGTLGRAVEVAMENTYRTFLGRRRVLNQAAQASALMYIAMREYRIEQRVQAKMDAGELPFREKDGKRTPLFGLSPEEIRAIEQELVDIRPTAHTAMSREANDLGAGLFTPKTKRELSQDDRAYVQSLKFQKGSALKGFDVTGMRDVLTDPGVRSLIMMVHSSDAAISAKAYSQLAALNVHDANGLSLADVVAGAQNLNEATYKVMLNFSVPLELKNTLDRTLVGIQKMLPEIEQSPELQEKLRTALHGEVDQDGNQVGGIRLSREQEERLGGDAPLTFVLKEVYEAAYAAEYRKLDAMAQMIYMDQYAQEGGEFLISDELRQEARDKQAAITAEARGGIDQEGNYRAEKLVVKTLARAEELSRALRPVPTRQAPEAAQETYDAPTYNAGLAELIGEAERRVQDHYSETGEVDAVSSQAITSMKKLSRALVRTNSLDKALNKLFPGTENQRKREAWTQRLDAQLEDRTLTLTNPRAVSMPVVFNAMDTMVRVKADPKGTIAETKRLMATEGMGFKEALKRLSDEDAGDVYSRVSAFYNGNRSTPFGELGSPVVDPDQELDAFLRSKPYLTAEDVVGYLKQRYSQPANNREKFNRLLLSQIEKTVPADLPIRYITRDNADQPAPEAGVSRARGWYEPANDNEHIGIKSPDFIHSAVQPEILLHELTHRALAGITTQAQSMPKTAPEAKLVADLENLRSAAQDWINEQGDAGLAARHAEAMTNVHEFLAWGLTNTRFQEEVLTQVVIEDKKRRNGFISAMQSFIDTITELLLGKKVRWKQNGKTMTTAMAQMLNRSAGLYAAARKGGEAMYDGQVLRSQQADPFTDVDQYSTERIFDELGSMQRSPLDPTYAEELKSVLRNITSKLHGPFGTYKDQIKDRANYSEADVFVESLLGNMPFRSEVLGQPFRISEQEAFVLEQVEATVQTSLDSSSMAYKELQKLFKETKTRLKPSDFDNGDSEQAQAVYDFIFRPAVEDGKRSNYLSRFAAMAVAYKPLRDKMDAQTSRDTRSFQNRTLAQKVRLIVEKLLDLLAGKLTKTYQGQRADEKLDRLLNQLVNIEAKKRASLARRKSDEKSMLSGAIEKLNDGARDKARKMASSGLIRNSRFGFVRAAGVTTRMIAGDYADEVFAGIQKVRNRMHKDREGVVASMVTEIRGSNDTNKAAYEFARITNKNEQDRQEVKDRTMHDVLGAFDDKGNYLTEDDSASLTRTVLRTDMTSLAEEFQMEELTELVRNDQYRGQVIKDYEKRLLALDKSRGKYWVTQGRDLAYNMVTGKVKSDRLMYNAHNIVQEIGTPNAYSVGSQKADQAQKLLDELVSLYAIEYTSEVDRGRTGEVMLRESRRGGEANGVSMVIKLHQKLKKDALEKLFHGNPIHFQKGYTKEIYNPYKEVMIASGVEAKNLERMGARPGPALPADPDDPTYTEGRRIYTIDDGGLKSWVTGNFSFTGTRPRGTLIHAGITRADNDGFVHIKNQQLTQQVEQDKAGKVAQLYARSLSYDPRKVAGSKMAPLLNGRGEVVNHRYVMSTRLRDTLLERDNRLEEIMGAMAANVLDRVNTQQTNRQLVQSLYDQYREDRKDNPNGYIEISDHSDDPEIRETYRLLPDDTKKEIVRVWGRAGMMVRKDLFNMHFGYRKEGLADLLGFGKQKRDPNSDSDNQRNIMQEVFVTLLEGMLGKKAALRIRQAEDVWQELVRMIKDFLVIKNLFTLVGNMSSNVSELALAGVPMRKIVEGHRVGFDGLIRYQRDRRELETLKTLVEIEHLDRPLQDVQDRITELEDSLARNPVRKLVDAGLMQTIVEDVENQEDRFSYKSRLARWTDSKTQWMPEVMKKAGKFAVVSHDTELYKVLYSTTHMSDFVARYALYEHVTNNGKDSMDHAEAIQYVEDAFVNYDVPTHKFIQYLNDMGLVMFTKYYLRIQKVLFRLYRENPARALALVLFANVMDMIPTIVESGFWNRLSNPLRGGATEFVDAIDEALPINTALRFVQ